MAHPWALPPLPKLSFPSLTKGHALRAMSPLSVAGTALCLPQDTPHYERVHEAHALACPHRPCHPGDSRSTCPGGDEHPQVRGTVDWAVSFFVRPTAVPRRCCGKHLCGHTVPFSALQGDGAHGEERPSSPWRNGANACSAERF